MSAQQNIQGTNPLNFKWTQTPATGPLAGIQIPYYELLRSIFGTAGQLADQVDGIIYKQLTMVASTPQTITLTSATDPLGDSITVARARFIIMKWYCTTDNVPALVGNAASHPVTILTPTSAGIVPVYPSTANNDGFTILAAPNTTGMVITASSSDQLKIDPQTGAGQFDLIILTCST